MSQRKKTASRQPAKGVGISKSGYQLPPVALPGLTKDERFRLKTTSSGSITKYKGDKSLKNRAKSFGKATPGRFFAEQGLWMATGAVQDMLRSRRNMKEEDQGYWNTVDTVGSVVGGAASAINPFLGALAGPVIELLGQAADSMVENERKALYDEAEKGCPNPGSIRFIECMALKDQLEKDAAAAKCERFEVTPEMLNGKTLEEVMKEYNVKPAKG